MDATALPVPVPSGWTGVVVLIVLGVIAMAGAAWAKRKANEKIVTTNPDDPDGRAALAERERMQDSADVSTEPERNAVRPAGGDKNP